MAGQVMMALETLKVRVEESRGISRSSKSVMRFTLTSTAADRKER